MDLKDDAGIWPQYGAIWIKALFILWAPKFLAAGPALPRQVNNGGRFWLTMKWGDAYIHRSARRPLTARLRASEAPHWNSESVSDGSRMRGLRRLFGLPKGGDRHGSRAV